MTNQWFRSWHGAPTDPKWLGIARKAGVAPGIVAAIVWALLDRASQASERGSIAGYDPDGMACFMGCEADQVEAIIAIMHEKGILADNAFTGWEKHQPRREDGSAERAKQWRERRRTQANAGEPERTLDTDTDTDTKQHSTAPRDELADLEKTLRQAAGWENEPAPGLFVTGPIQTLLDNGASLELDVLPVIRGRAKSIRAQTWKYFVPAIREAMQARIQAATGPPAAAVVPFVNSARSNHGPRSNTIAAGFDLIDRAIEQRERALAAAQGGAGRGEDDPLSLP